MRVSCRRLLVGLSTVFMAASAAPMAQVTPAPALIDLRSAVVVTSARPTAREKKAVQVLVEEVQKRTLITLPVATSATAGRPSINIGRIGSLPGGARSSSAGLSNPGAEGFQLVATGSGAAAEVTVAGADERGVLFGVGRLLRELRMDRGTLAVAPSLRLSTTPQTPLRGHQLGYRPKTNSYDGWTVAMWDQYIRDLAVFGNNAIELIPPRSDDDADSPHFSLPPIEMMVEMSRIADEYGLDVWIWYPALDKDYGDPATVDFAVKEWADVFKRLPRIDAILVPGGDPGHTEPRHMFTLLERQTASLRQFHPKATMWLSPQGFTVDWMNQFYDLMAKQPAWLTGLVFGPQVRDPLPTLRAKIDKRYKIRRYPDITHSLRAQYPVPDWDIAHAQTSNREPINPRPLDQTAIYRALDEHAIGFITYSEGCNDDVNKIVWSNLGWDRNADPLETLRQYSRYFIGDRYTDSFAQGLLSLERNWRGPLASNAGVDTTLQQFQAMERAAAPRDLLNWRFQQALYRAYYDAYVRQRLLSRARAGGGRDDGTLARTWNGRARGARRRRCRAGARDDGPGGSAASRTRRGACRGPLPEHPHAACGEAVRRDCRRPRRDARHGGHAAQRSRLADRALQGDPRPRQGGRAAGGDRYDPALDGPRARRLLRRPRRSLPSAAPDSGSGPADRSWIVQVHGDRIRLPARLAPLVDDARRVLL